MKKSSITTTSLEQSSRSSTTGSNAKKNLGDLANHTNQRSQWTSMKSFLENSRPFDLCPDKPTVTNPKLAKDSRYAEAVLEQWKREIELECSSGPQPDNDSDAGETIGATFPYLRSIDEAPLNGYIVIESNLIKREEVKNSTATVKKNVPAVILFHTGAGPQDVFLRWKADMLARDPMWGNDGCVVLIADIVGDSTGWTWTDRERYDETRKTLLQRTVRDNDTDGHRWKLRETVAAAVEALKSIEEVDGQNIAAMGWCLGGHPVLELSRMKLEGVNTLVTFHGVFDGIRDEFSGVDITNGQNCVLICNGKSDPFVSKENLEIGKKTFEKHSWDVEILDFDHVKHGFTNPAQDYNPSDAFAFDEEASNTSWNTAKALLRKQLF